MFARKISAIPFAGPALCACVLYFALTSAVQIKAASIKNDAPDFLTARPDTAIPWSKVQVKPVFPGGQKGLFKYLSENILYPKDARMNGQEGIVYINFTVDKNGHVMNLDVDKNGHVMNLDVDKNGHVMNLDVDKNQSGLLEEMVVVSGFQPKAPNAEISGSDGEKSIEAEALRVVKSMPAWKPGKQKGRPADVAYTIPIRFKMEN